MLYPDIRWHSLERARATVGHLLALRRIWGLKAPMVSWLEGCSEELARLDSLRQLLGADGPVVLDRAEDLDLPVWARGLQGYQVNFAPARYESVRARAVAELGPPTGGGELAYLALLASPARPLSSFPRRPSVMSLPWFLTVLEHFEWARDREGPPTP